MRPSKKDIENAAKTTNHRDNVKTDRQTTVIAVPTGTLYLISTGQLVSKEESEAEGVVVVGTQESHGNGFVKYHIKMNQCRQVYRDDENFKKESESYAGHRKMPPYKMVMTNKDAFGAYQRFLQTKNPAIARLAESLLAG